MAGRPSWLLLLLACGCGAAEPAQATIALRAPGSGPQLAVGAHHACVLLAGVAWCFGENNYGQRGVVGPADTPLPVANLTEPVIDLAADATRTCACTAAGHVWCWGRRSDLTLAPGQTVPEGPIAPVPVPPCASVRVDHGACVLDRDGGVSCWPGYLGTQTLDGLVPMPARLPVQPGTPEDPTWTTAPPRPIPLPRPAVEIGIGMYHGCAVLDDGSVACWGQNAFGQLTDGRLDGVVVHAAPRAFPPEATQAIAAGYMGTCLVVGGRVYCWGMIYLPGARHCAALLSEWRDFAPQESLSIMPAPCRPGFAAVPRLRNARLVSVGSRRACVIDTRDDLLCWDSEEPVPAVVAQEVVAIDMDLFSGCVINRAGEVLCWGMRVEGMTIPDEPPGARVAHIVGDRVEPG